ncbi:MAG: flavin reductase family protein, partial [Deltaproteobacteria bacterium]|nr:flavin reductase family protein [Deltaproteobacteria bacterium]
MQKRQLGPCVTFFPQPTTLVASTDNFGQINLMMASWAGIVSKSPPTMAVSLHHNRQTYANILETEIFSVNVVTPDFVAEADLCGLCSGKHQDKLSLTGLKTEPAKVTGAPLIVDSPLNVECRFYKTLELGDYRLILGEIVEIYACDRAYNDNGKVDAKSFNPLV